MDIVSYYREQPLSVSNVTVKVNPEDRKRADHLILRTSAILTVEGPESLTKAKHAAGQLKALLNEIESAKKASRGPYTAIAQAINVVAQEIGAEVEAEHKRVLGLLNSYVAKVEAERAAEEKAKQEAIRRAQEEHDRRIAQAQAAQQEAEERARKALDEAAREKARADATTQMLVVTQQQLAKEMALEVAKIGADKPRASLVPGGRVDHPFEYTLKNIREVIQAGCLNLLRWELDKRACQDSVRAQLEIDPNREPSLPGIEISRNINVSVRASARVL
jgi:GMP synthase-like glutamine amidotransferase